MAYQQPQQQQAPSTHQLPGADSVASVYQNVTALNNAGQFREAATYLLKTFIETRYDSRNQPPEPDDSKFARLNFRLECMTEYRRLISEMLNFDMDPFDSQALPYITNDPIDHPAFRAQAAYIHGMMCLKIGDSLAQDLFVEFSKLVDTMITDELNVGATLSTLSPVAQTLKQLMEHFVKAIGIDTLKLTQYMKKMKSLAITTARTMASFRHNERARSEESTPSWTQAIKRVGDQFTLNNEQKNILRARLSITPSSAAILSCCANCFTIARPLKACDQCNRIVFCNEKCRVEYSQACHHALICRPPKQFKIGDVVVTSDLDQKHISLKGLRNGLHCLMVNDGVQTCDGEIHCVLEPIDQFVLGKVYLVSKFLTLRIPVEELNEITV
ncbi:hypothetical protein HDU76_003563 [Blyttiomyces sp. JEL0837]|nr:hypothetical protein HDU76_003563 [Blyttiomyces sp. JEL0837]